METEVTLIQIFQEVVGSKAMNRDTRFLDIGGNSLNLVEVLKQIQQKFGVTPSPRIFFDKTRSTVAGIGAEIDARLEESGAVKVAG